ncbi:MAG: ATP-binding protein [Alphaproteobacteria bacterium]|nr:ATP-binding protein [Alphaproteobacteria bacterium]
MWIKKFLPKSLFGRALLILVLPTVLIQLLMAYIFYDRHWLAVTRYMSSSLAGETAFLVMQLRQAPANEKPQMVHDFERSTSLRVQLLSGDAFDSRYKSPEFIEYQHILRQKIAEPFLIRRLKDGDTIEVRVKLPGQVVKLQTTSKRLESPTTTIFLIWMVGSSILLLWVAIIFLRNQLRPISRLAKASDNFGRGIDTPDFRPQGATEVRIAARAFITMRERIRRQIRTRTDMLSGISHDLRTPLTRMKLQLAMLGDSEAIRELEGDVKQMEYMIAEYLDFARGEGGEEAVTVYLHKLLAEIVADYARSGHVIGFVMTEEIEIDLKPTAFRRMLHNLLDNALRYAGSPQLSYMRDRGSVRILIDDEGEGIPEAMREEVFRPFTRLDASRNVNTGGVGLGLTIARDIVLAHGGAIDLAESPQGGLRVIITLPLGKN